MQEKNRMQILELIYNRLTSQKFSDWYNTRLDKHISDPEVNGISKEMILEDIAALFSLRGD